MRGYLLDTNIVSYWFDEGDPLHGRVVGRVSELCESEPQSPIRISAITWGEIEYGHQAEAPDGRTPIQLKYEKSVRDTFPNVLSIQRSTTGHYGELRSRLFAKYAKKKGKKARRPEQLIDPATSRDLGVQENDIWMAAQAIEYNLVLVTHDDMTHVREVSQGLLTIEDWAS